MENEIDVNVRVHYQCPMITEIRSRELVLLDGFVISYEIWEYMPSSVMAEYWTENSEEIRSFIVEMLVWISPPNNKVCGFYNLLVEISEAVNLGLESHWVEYVKSHRQDFLEKKTLQEA